MPSRRSHRKSHHGCTACKRRKIKCDERRPECGSCGKNQVSCSFRHDSCHELSREPNSSHLPLVLVNDNSILPMLEIQLLHQWYTSTAQELSGGSQDVQKVLTEIIPH